MRFYIYHSELTHRTIVSFIDHGKAWAMPDGETYDLQGNYFELGDPTNNEIVICGEGEMLVSKVSDLA